MVDYFQIISKYIKPSTQTYNMYVVHCSLVTSFALQIAKKLKLSVKQLEFIEEASMLHDIGICRVRDYENDCGGSLPYICHGVEGAKILEDEGLKKHALVAKRHNGVGIFSYEVREKNLPIPEEDYVPITLEEEIISFADIFYKKSKNKLWYKQSLEEAREEIAQFGQNHLKIFEYRVKKFLD